MESLNDLTLDQLTDAHNGWLAELDPLVGPAGYPSVETERLVRLPEGVAGYWRVNHSDPEQPYSLWSPDAVESLAFRSASLPTAASFNRLLGAWLAARDATPATLSVSIPALATGPIPALVKHGFAPVRATAIRLVPNDPDPILDGVDVRGPQARDRESLLDLLHEMHRHELVYGSSHDRPRAREHLGTYLDEAMARPDWAWVAWRDGRAVGLLTLNPQETSAWVAPLVSLERVAYLGFAAVTSSVRHEGVGTALVRHAFHRARRADVQAVVLDHAALSPLSSTFWHRQGFRPLWHQWARAAATSSAISPSAFLGVQA